MSLLSDYHIKELYPGQLSVKKCTKCSTEDRCKFVSINSAEPEYICRSCLKKMGAEGWHQSREGVNQALEMADYEKLPTLDEGNNENQSNTKQRIKTYLPILGLELLGIGILIFIAGLSPVIGGENVNVVNGYFAAAVVLILIEIIHILFPEGERLSSMVRKGSALKSKGKGMFSSITNRFKKNNNVDTNGEFISGEEHIDNLTPVNAFQIRNRNAGLARENVAMPSQAVTIMGDIPEHRTNILCKKCKNVYMLQKNNNSDMIKCPACGSIDFISRRA